MPNPNTQKKSCRTRISGRSFQKRKGDFLPTSHSLRDAWQKAKLLMRH